ncbi:MAG: hypothetical protein Kow00121_26420 [Elainellaceae cyanobacterium]
MIHHISIAAQHPLHVAEVLAEIWRGQAAPFPPHPGSFMVMALDEFGTLIEVYPAGTELTPGANEAEFSHNATPSPYQATHAAVSVPASREEIEQIGAREGWTVRYCSREGFFDVIEFWIENTLMIELLTPQMAAKYIAFMQPEHLAQVLADLALEPVTV